MDRIFVIKNPIDQDALELLVAGLEAACGGNKIRLEEQFELRMVDERQYNALRALFGKKRAISGTVASRAKNPGAHSYTYEAEGEQRSMTAQALRRGLLGHEIEPGTIFVDAKRRYWMVNTDYELIRQQEMEL